MLLSQKTYIRHKLQEGKTVDQIVMELSQSDNGYTVEHLKYIKNKHRWELQNKVSIYSLADALEHAKSIVETKIKNIMSERAYSVLCDTMVYQVGNLKVTIKEKG